VGVASVYRYFKSKTDLVIAAAELFWLEDINVYYRNYFKNKQNNGNGYSQVKDYFNIFLELFDNHKIFIKFIEDFDSYLVREQVQKEKLEQYDSVVHYTSSILEEALESGLNDKSICNEIDPQKFAHTASQSLMGLCQKHVSKSHLIPSDLVINGRDEIELLIKICLEYINPD